MSGAVDSLLLQKIRRGSIHGQAVIAWSSMMNSSVVFNTVSSRDVPINRNRYFCMEAASTRVGNGKILKYLVLATFADSFQNLSDCKLLVFWFQSGIVNSNCSKCIFYKIHNFILCSMYQFIITFLKK